MVIVYIVLGMIAAGLLMGWVAGLIWKDRTPEEARRDYIVAVISAVAMGFVSWYVVPAMGFSDTLRNISLATEPAGLALIVLWLIRKAKQ